MRCLLFQLLMIITIFVEDRRHLSKYAQMNLAYSAFGLHYLCKTRNNSTEI